MVKNGLVGRTSEVLAYYRTVRSPRALLGPSLRRVMGRVRVPSLHLHGADDGCVGVGCSQGAERFYDAPYRLSVIPRAGHFLQREAPDAVSDELLRFFS